MDEAYRHVRALLAAAAESGAGDAGAGAASSLWANMAQMGVKSGRLDIAQVCLGHMGNARGAAAARALATEPEAAANVAVVATQLGMLPDAARLLQAARRPDLLAKLLADGASTSIEHARRELTPPRRRRC